MKIKELLIKLGGLISSIALLGSMFTMSGAFYVPDAKYTCSVCGNEFSGLYSNPKPTTYQEYYSVGNIDGFSSISSSHVYSGTLLKIVFLNGNPICKDCLDKKIAEYKAANANSLSTPGVGNTPITVTADPSTFSVTVPTSISLVINADGSVTAPTDVKIVNGSAGSVQVSSIVMNNGDWSLTDYNGGNHSKLAEAKVDSKKLGLSLAVNGNAASTSKDGSQTPSIDVSKWTMAGGTELPITVGAIATANSVKAASEVTAANVVFTLAWV